MKKYNMPATEVMTVLSCANLLSGSVTMGGIYGDPMDTQHPEEGSVQL